MPEYVEKDEFEAYKFNIQKQLKALAQKPQPTAERVLSGALTLKTHDRRVQFIDPGGANRDITLPAEAGFVKADPYFFIFNTADAAENLVIKDDSAVTIITISQNEGGIVWCNGTVWKGFVGGIT